MPLICSFHAKAGFHRQISAAWQPRSPRVYRCDQYFSGEHIVHSSDTLIFSAGFSNGNDKG